MFWLTVVEDTAHDGVRKGVGAGTTGHIASAVRSREGDECAAS